MTTLNNSQRLSAVDPTTSTGKTKDLLTAVHKEGARIKFAVGVAAVCLATVGLALLFAGTEVAGAVVTSPVAEPFPSLLGAAMIAFASMNWIARHNLLGGIHGRAVVVSNQTHLTIGAILLVKHGLARGGTPSFWILTALYVTGAVLFNLLLMGRGLPTRGGASAS